MDDAASTVAKCMEDEPGEMTRQEIIDEVAFTLLDEVAEYFDTYRVDDNFLKTRKVWPL